MLLEVLIPVNSLRKIRCISLLSLSRQLVSSTQEHPSLWPKWSWSQLHMGKGRVHLWMSCILVQGSIWAFGGLVTSLSQNTIKVLSMPVLNQEPSASQTCPTHTELPMLLILNFKIRNITEYLQITHGWLKPLLVVILCVNEGVATCWSDTQKIHTHVNFLFKRSQSSGHMNNELNKHD